MNLFRKRLPDTESALATLQAEFDTLNANFGSLQDSFRDSENMVATLKSEIAERIDSEAQLKARITELETENASLIDSAASVKAQAASMAIDTLASLGTEPVESNESDSLDILSQFKALPQAERADFFKQHKNQLLNL